MTFAARLTRTLKCATGIERPAQIQPQRRVEASCSHKSSAPAHVIGILNVRVMRTAFVSHSWHAGSPHSEGHDAQDSVFTDEEYEDEFREMVGDWLANFVTNPDLGKGFQWSGKTQSHIQLESVNSSLRRRLAATFVSLEKNPCNLGGLLDNAFVHENVLDRIHELGQSADDLCNECIAAKRGSADLTRRTEALEHSAKLLNNWIDWLRRPTMPGADGKHVEIPPGPPSPPPVPDFDDVQSETPSPELSARRAAPPGPLGFAGRAAREREKVRAAAAERQAAADRAMQALLEGARLQPCSQFHHRAARARACACAIVQHHRPGCLSAALQALLSNLTTANARQARDYRHINSSSICHAEEDNEAKARQAQDKKKESKKQRRRERKQASRPACPSNTLDATSCPHAGSESSGGKDTGAVSKAKKKMDDAVVDMLDAHGEHVKAKRIQGGFGIPGVAAEAQEDFGTCYSLGPAVVCTSSMRVWS